MLNFLLDLALIQIVFSLIYDYLFAMPVAFLQAKIGTDSMWWQRIIKGIGAMIFGSLSANAILFHNDENLIVLVIYSVIAYFLLVLNLAAQTRNIRKEIDEIGYQNFRTMEYKWRMEEELSYHGIYWIIALISLVLTLIFPAIGENPMNLIFESIKDWIMSIKILSYFLIGFSIFLYFYFIFNGFLALIVYRSMKKNSNEDNEIENE